MQLQNRELSLPALAVPEIRPAECDIATLRRPRHLRRLDVHQQRHMHADRPDLRHNGNGLVWLHSGVSVHEADSDTGLKGSDKVSHEYHEGVCEDNKLKDKGLLSFVQPRKLDDYCLNILINSSACTLFEQRRNGKPLSTFALQIDLNVRRKATDGWFVFQNPRQSDKYELLDTKRYSGLTKNYKRLGWHRHTVDYLTGIFKNDAEFSRLMTRLGYVSIRT